MKKSAKKRRAAPKLRSKISAPPTVAFPDKRKEESRLHCRRKDG